MAERKFAIRFSVEDMEKVRAALKGMGDDGASALRAIERQSRQATPQMKAIDSAAKEVRQTFDEWANRIPVIGGALQALGPIGTTVAAGFAGITLGLSALSNAARQAVQDIGNMKDAADAVGLEVEDFQAIRGVGLLSGVDRSEMESMLATLAANSARASEGFGRMKTALDKVNPELSRQLALTSSQAERLNILAQATQEATTYNDKLNISIAAFGNSGGKMVAMLDEQGAAMDTWKERARGAGLVLEEELVQAVDAMGDRLEAARARTEVAVQRLAVTMAPFEEWVETFKGDVTQGFAFLFQGDPFKSLEDQSTGYLANEFNKLQARYWTMRQRGVPEGSESFAGYAERIDAMSKELVRRYEQAAKEQAAAASAAAQEQLKADAESFGEWLNGWLIDEAKRDRTEAERLAKEAEQKAAEQARQREQREKDAIETRAQLGDWTGKLAAEEERLNALVADGLLSREAANAALAKTRAELDGTAAAVQRWKSAIEATETPVEKAYRAMEEFVAEAMKIPDRGPAFQAALRAYAGAIDDARQAAKEATPAFKAAAEARERIARDIEGNMSIEERVAAYAREVNALAAAFDKTGDPEVGLRWEEATRAIQAYRDELEATADAQRDANFEIRLASAALNEILDENMNSLEDLGRVALRVFREMAIEWILTNQKMASSQGVMEFIGNALTSMFTGGPGARPDPALGAYPGATNPDPSLAAYGINHMGSASIGSGASQIRFLPTSLLANTPRFHAGLAPDEFPSILQRGERVLSVVHNERLVQAVENGGSPNVEVHFHGQFGERPEVKQSRSADGGTRIDVYARKAVAAAIADGAADRAMESRFGLKRAVGV